MVDLLLSSNYNHTELQIACFYKIMFQVANRVFGKENSINVLWNNSDITVDGQTIFYPTWYEKNIMFFQDLFSLERKMLSYDKFKQQYDLKY